jgi:hypothetical protein
LGRGSRVSSAQDMRATCAAPLAVTDRPPSCQHITVLIDLAGMGGKPPLMASGMDVRLALHSGHCLVLDGVPIAELCRRPIEWRAWVGSGPSVRRRSVQFRNVGLLPNQSEKDRLPDTRAAEFVPQTLR